MYIFDSKQLKNTTMAVPGSVWLNLRGFWLWKKWELDVKKLRLNWLQQQFSGKRVMALQEVLLPQSATELECHEAFRQLQEWGNHNGWNFFELPAYSDRQTFLADVNDSEQKAAFEDAFHAIDILSSDYHDMMHDIGPKGRAEVYANQPLSTYMLGIYQGT